MNDDFNIPNIGKILLPYAIKSYDNLNKKIGKMMSKMEKINNKCKQYILDKIMKDELDGGGLQDALRKINDIEREFDLVSKPEVVEKIKDNIQNVVKILKESNDMGNSIENMFMDIDTGNNLKRAFMDAKNGFGEIKFEPVNLLPKFMEYTNPLDDTVGVMPGNPDETIFNYIYTNINALSEEVNMAKGTALLLPGNIKSKMDELLTETNTRITNNNEISAKLTDVISKLDEILNKTFANANAFEQQLEKSIIYDIGKICELSSGKGDEIDVELNRMDGHNVREISKKINKIIDGDASGNLKTEYKECFDGVYTISITRNFLGNGADRKNKINALSRINMGATNIYEIIKKDFNNFPTFPSTVTGGKRQRNHRGITDYPTLITEILDKKKLYIESVTNVRKLIKSYNEKACHIMHYIIFMIQISTMQLLVYNDKIYTHMNGGLVKYYLRIVSEINKQIDEDSNSTNDAIKFMRTNYYLVIKKIHFFLEKAEIVLRDKDTILSLNHRELVDYKEYVLIFNSFKGILDAYNKLFNNKLTIYARINDIKPQKTGDRCSKYGVTKAENKPTSYTFHNHGETGKVLKINPAKCKNVEEDKKNKDFVFTGVYDTNDYPTNTEISKYMVLDSLLTEGKSMALLTYGYSGTGKTYTLFGTKGGTQGLLQATLNEIVGLDKVTLRIYELYGKGVLYDFYWKENGKPKTDEIFHTIYAYAMKMSDDGNLKLDGSPKIVSPSKISTDIPAVEISGDDVRSVFENFSSGIASEVENIRERDKRICETPNNRVSSRSILIYDFKLSIAQKNGEPSKDTTFLIVDLPGREDLYKTYVRSYFGIDTISDDIGPGTPNDGTQIDVNRSNIIRDLLFKPKEKVTPEIKNNLLKLVRTTAMAMAINPLYVPVLRPKLFIRACQTMINKTVWDEIYNKGIKRSDIKLNPSARNKDSIERFRIIETKNFIFKLDEEIISPKLFPLKKIFLNLANQDFKIGDKGRVFGLNQYTTKSSLQYYGLLGIYILNRLILMKKFDIIEKIFSNVMDKLLNSRLDVNIPLKYNNIDSMINALKNNIDWGFKRESSRKLSERLKRIKASNNIIGKSDMNDFVNLFKYEYFATPFEGMYINENIMGLMAYMIETCIGNEGNKALSKQNLKSKIIEQTNIKLEDMLYRCRMALRHDDQRCSIKGDLSQKITDPTFSTTVDNVLDIKNRINEATIEKMSQTAMNIGFSREQVQEPPMYTCLNGSLVLKKSKLEDLQKKFKTDYISDRIFCKDRQLIADILSPYLDIPSVNPAIPVIPSIGKISEFKLFYLLANYYDDHNEFTDEHLGKCWEQIHLLEKTESFLDIINN